MVAANTGLKLPLVADGLGLVYGAMLAVKCTALIDYLNLGLIYFVLVDLYVLVVTRSRYIIRV